MSHVTPISTDDLRRLHPRTIESRDAILALLQRLQRDRSPLWRSTNRFSERETAKILEVSGESFILETENFSVRDEAQIFLNFQLCGQPYFLSAPPIEKFEETRIRLSLPAVIYQAERRDRARNRPAASTINLVTPRQAIPGAHLADVSPDGLAVEIPAEISLSRGTWVRVVPTPADAGALAGGFAEVRHVRPADRSGWQRVGLSLTRERPSAEVRVETAELGQAQSTHFSDDTTESMLGTKVPLVRYYNNSGEEICGIVDIYGEPGGATAVIIPPAWGRTKETLLPLAATILASFRAARTPVIVVRFDGIRKRGQSHLDPECRRPGFENLHFTFSQGAEDIQATIDYLHTSELLRPAKTILITFSVASIEGRRAMAIAGDRLSGWISVVGSADAQSLTRVISGGVDFFGGAERGVTFGYQEIQGMLVDMDRAANDALVKQLAFLDDSRKDLLRVEAPITWIHGRHDAWMDLERVKHVLQFGTTENRKVLVVPTGHQLRTSEEAMATFELIAQEVGLMALGRRISPRRPDPFDLADRAQAERVRLERPKVNLRSFWRDYLVGRSAGAGIALVASTSPYLSLMRTQVEALDLRDGDSVADLGCGIGTFASFLRERGSEGYAPSLRVIAIDYVREALTAGRAQALEASRASGVNVMWVQASLDVAAAQAFVPLRSASQDAVLLSLVLNYVPSPGVLLGEVHRILKPAGRLVLSSLKRDADISGICVDAVSELRRGRGREVFGEEGEKRLGEALQSFISDASRLLDLEEAGLFHFWNEVELLAMMEAAGFTVAKRARGLGAAPQAYVVVARR